MAVAEGGRERLDTLLSPVLRALGRGEGSPPLAGGASAYGPGCGFRVAGHPGKANTQIASGTQAILLFDGRLENRAALAAALGVDAAGPSDAQLVLALWERSGEAAFAELRGPFAVVVQQAPGRRLVMARDVLGDRSLSYWWGGQRQAPFLAAPDSASLLAAPGVSGDWNDRSVARLFAIQAPLPGETYFAAVHEVPRGHVVSWTAEGGVEIRRFTRLAPDWSARRERDPVGRLRELLTEAVRASLGAPGTTGILLSGGLDSAAIASRAAALTSPGERPAALTWVFDELPAGEPTESIAGLVEALGLPWHPIVADQLWPLGGGDWTVERSFPSADLYQRPLRESLRRASELGLEVLFNGQYGDHLWVEGGMWLRALLRRGRPDLAATSLLRQWRLDRSGGPRRGTARGALRRVLPITPVPTAPPAWLTAEASAWALADAGEDAPPTGVNAAQWASVTDPLASQGIHWNRRLAARWGIDVRFPYRYRPLVEWLLATPADRLYSPGANKLLLRQMLRAEVPASTANRWRAGSLAPLAIRGLVERERGLVDSVLRDPAAAWPRFVRREWVLNGLGDRFRREHGAPGVIGWLCVCLELWRKELDSRALAA